VIIDEYVDVEMTLQVSVAHMMCICVKGASQTDDFQVILRNVCKSNIMRDQKLVVILFSCRFSEQQHFFAEFVHFDGF